MNSKSLEKARTLVRLASIGISAPDAMKLFAIERILHHWAERECNGEVETDEETGKTFSVYGHDRPGPVIRTAIANQEARALKRLAVIMERYPRLWSYHQGDPRGCALSVGRWVDLPEVNPGDPNLKDARTILEGYYTRGVAVCY